MQDANDAVIGTFLNLKDQSGLFNIPIPNSWNENRLTIDNSLTFSRYTELFLESNQMKQFKFQIG